VGIQRWFKRMEGPDLAMIESIFRCGRDTIRPGGASEDVGIDPSRLIMRRRGAHSKKLRSRVTESCPGGHDVSLNVVRFARLVQGRCVMTPPRLSSRKDERSPSKECAVEDWSGCHWWMVEIDV
jgi:hypothetical protein